MFFFTYFTPKSSTTSVNCTGRHFFFQSPGTNLLCWQPRLLSLFSRILLAGSPDCGNPYMPRLATIYTAPFASVFYLSLYSVMISSGMSLTCMWVYSGRFSGVMRQKLDISIVMNLAPFVDMKLLNRILADRISTVGVATSPGQSILYPPTLNLVLFFFFYCRALHMNFPYVTSFLRFCCMSFLLMNDIVLVRIFMHPPTPFASCPNSFAEDVLQFFLYFGFLISCL